MVRRRATRQRFRGTSPQGFVDGKPLGADLRQAELVGAGSSNDDEIHAGRDQIRPRSEALTTHPLDSIASHGGAHFAAHDQAQA